MIHCDGPPKKFSPALVGSRCIVGAGATMHGATLEDESKVGDRATVLDFAIIRKHGVLAPGSLLLSGKEIKSGELWSGVPAKFQRRLTETEVAAIASEAANLSELATAHAAETDKSWQQQYADREDFYETVLREDYYRKRLSKEEYAERSGDIDGHSFPGRVLDSDG
jgi:carbonic anhydrase/acetyltransferase-like protein (isoleucine patch superfamily)